MANEATDPDILLTRLADEFAARYRRGERPTLREYIEKHPELADDIRDVFPAMVEIEQARDDREDPTPGAPPRLPPLPPLQQLGDFRILREIGRGGMGVVYEAEQISLGRHVALKVLPQKAFLDGTQKQRFEREAKTAAKLHHSNIVPVFAVGEHDGLPYYAMQFIQGLGLDLVIEELQRLQAGGAAEKGTGPLNSKGPVPFSAGRRTARGDVSAAQVAQSLLTGEFAATVDLPRNGDVAPITNEYIGAADSRSRGDFGSLHAASARADTSLASSLATLNAPSVILPGQSGADPSSRSGKMTYWKSVAQVGIQVAEALAYAHDQGLLHRDIKPSNLLLDTHGTVWVTDFGLAKADDHQNLTQRGDIIGTLRYMPPEAFDAKNEPRSDIYSLGLTLYEMLALRPAFEASDRQQLIRQVTSESATPLDCFNRHVPRDLVTIVHKAMDREPAHRYATARDLAADLRRFCADESIQARRPTRSERLLRWTRHHPGLAASLGVIALILMVATVVSGVAALSFQQLAKNEETARKNAEEVGAKERWERYRANIAAASAALHMENSSAARRALEAAPETHRNWEWRHLHHQLDSSRIVLRGLGRPLPKGALSPDWRLVAVAAKDGTVRLTDTTSSRVVTILRGHTELATKIVFSPDGTRVATGGGDGLRLWDTATGAPGAVLLAGTPIRSIAWAPDGRHVAACTDGNLFRAWNTDTGRLVATANGNREITFRPDSRRIARNLGSAVFVWDLEAGKEATPMVGEKTSPTSIAYSPDGRLIAAGYAYPESAVRLWDAATGRLIGKLSGHANTVDHLAFSPDGTRLASCSGDRTARLWDTAEGRLVATLRGHSGSVNGSAFSRDGRRFLTASDDQTLRLWDVATGEPIAVLRGHKAPVNWAAISPDGQTFASASEEGAVCFWDAALAERQGVFTGHTDFVYDVAFSWDGGRVASASWDGTIRLWDPDTGRPEGVLRRDGVKDPIVGALAFSPDRQRLASVHRNGGVTLWDLAKAKPDRVIDVPTGGWTGDARAAFNATGTLLAVGNNRGHVHLIDPATGTVQAILNATFPEAEEDTTNTRDVAFSPDGTVLAATGYDGKVRLWDVASRTIRKVLTHTSPVYAVAFSRDGRFLASADHSGAVRLWDGETYQELATLPHRGRVHAVAFSPDGTRLATACADNSIRLWDVDTRQEVAELRGHSAYVHAVAWSPDGTRLVSGSGDTTVRIWDSLSVQERAQRAADASRP